MKLTVTHLDLSVPSKLLLVCCCHNISLHVSICNCMCSSVPLWPLLSLWHSVPELLKSVVLLPSTSTEPLLTPCLSMKLNLLSPLFSSNSYFYIFPPEWKRCVLSSNLTSVHIYPLKGHAIGGRLVSLLALN